MPSPIMQYFAYAHLPPELQGVSAAIANVAEGMELSLPDGAEKSAGLRKLLEAKDCFVRAAIVSSEPVALPSQEVRIRSLEENLAEMRGQGAATVERIAYLEQVAAVATVAKTAEGPA